MAEVTVSGMKDFFESAISAPFQTFGGQDLFPTVAEKAVRLCVGLVQNHPFYDGNKRIGALALLTTLDLNNINLTTNSSDLSSVILDLASGKIKDADLLQWVMNRID